MNTNEYAKFGNPDDIRHPQCNFCIHLDNEEQEVWRCKAFPKEIPDDIVDAFHDHQEPFPGDNGIRFEQRPERKPLNFKLRKKINKNNNDFLGKF